MDLKQSVQSFVSNKIDCDLKTLVLLHPTLPQWLREPGYYQVHLGYASAFQGLFGPLLKRRTASCMLRSQLHELLLEVV